MIGLVLISETRTAIEMLKAAYRILGVKDLPQVEVVCLRAENHLRTLRSRLNQAIEKVDDQHGVVILSEVYGSSQAQIASEFVHEDAVEMVCGYSLPMLLKALQQRACGSVSELTKVLECESKKYIRRVA